MKLEQQVVSLELAKRLKELGVKQESLFNWYVAKMGTPEILFERTGYYEGDWYSAFTVAELGELLDHIEYMRPSSKGEKYKYWKAVTEKMSIYEFSADTEADARAKCLVYLIENKLITV